MCSLPRSLPETADGWVGQGSAQPIACDAAGALDAPARQRMIEQRGREWLDRVVVRGANAERCGHDASGRSGSVRRLSDVRESRSHVGDAQVVAP